MRSQTRSLNCPSTAQSCVHEYCWNGHRPHVRWWNSVERPYHTDYNGQSIHKVGVTKYGIELFSCVFNAPQKVPKVTTCTRICRWVFLCFFVMCLFMLPKRSRNSEHLPHWEQLCIIHHPSSIIHHQSSIISQLIDCLTLKQGWISQISLISNYDHDRQHTTDNTQTGTPVEASPSGMA